MPLKVRSDREPIVIPIPRVGSNPPDDPDTATTASATVPNQETTSKETAQSVAERIQVRPAEAEAEGAPVVQRTRTTVSVPVTATAETTSQTTTISLAKGTR